MLLLPDRPEEEPTPSAPPSPTTQEVTTLAEECKRQARRATEAATALEDAAVQVVEWTGRERVTYTSAAERRLIRLMYDGGRNAERLSDAAEQTAKTLKLRWLADQWPGGQELQGINDHCSRTAWGAFQLWAAFARETEAEGGHPLRKMRQDHASELTQWAQGLYHIADTATAAADQIEHGPTTSDRDLEHDLTPQLGG